jgi:hypothetical protein
MIALVWKASAVEAAPTPDRFVSAVAEGLKSPPSGPVAVVRPRVPSASHIPTVGTGLLRPLSATTYSMILAAVLIAMALPPVISMIASAGSSGAAGPSTSVDHPSPSWKVFSGPSQRSAV